MLQVPAGLPLINDPQNMIDNSTSPTRLIAFHPATVDIKTKIDGPVAATATVQKDPLSQGKGIVVIEQKNLAVDGLVTTGQKQILIRVFRLSVTPPKDSAIVDPNSRPTPPHDITFGIETDSRATDAEAVVYPTKVVTQFYCQVLEPSTDAIFHVRTVSPIVA
jgi:hypothetical protein